MLVFPPTLQVLATGRDDRQFHLRCLLRLRLPYLLKVDKDGTSGLIKKCLVGAPALAFLRHSTRTRSLRWQTTNDLGRLQHILRLPTQNMWPLNQTGPLSLREKSPCRARLFVTPFMRRSSWSV